MIKKNKVNIKKSNQENFTRVETEIKNKVRSNELKFTLFSLRRKCLKGFFFECFDGKKSLRAALKIK